MNEGQTSSWQFTLALIVSIIVFGGGTVWLTAVGREVNPALWAIDGGLANALVAHAGFFTQRAGSREAMAHLAHANDALRSIAAPRMTTTNTAGEVKTVIGGSDRDGD